MSQLADESMPDSTREQPPSREQAGEQVDATWAAHEEHCLDMFHRALLQQNLQAQRWVQEHFYTIVLGWMHMHPLKQEACRARSAEYYVMEAFTHFWRWTQSDPAPSLALLLRYLQASLNSVILETLRESVGPQAQHEAAGTDANSASENRALWEHLLRILADEREQRLAYLFFHCGLKVSEIVRFCPQEFPDLQEVCHMKLSILERFVSTRRLQEYHSTGKKGLSVL